MIQMMHPRRISNSIFSTIKIKWFFNCNCNLYISKWFEFEFGEKSTHNYRFPSLECRYKIYQNFSDKKFIGKCFLKAQPSSVLGAPWKILGLFQCFPNFLSRDTLNQNLKQQPVFLQTLWKRKILTVLKRKILTVWKGKFDSLERKFLTVLKRKFLTVWKGNFWQF